MLQIKRLALDDAKVLIRGATRKSNNIGIPMCIAVSDESGNLISFERMDGAKILSVTLANDKAMTAAISKRGTHEYNEASQPGNLTFGIYTALGGRFCIVGGGYPVIVRGQVIGGIGVSGGAPEQDMQAAQAGIDLFLKGLKTKAPVTKQKK